MQSLVAMAAGILFGAGLTISRMVNPTKVLNFLDFAAIGDGTWDATLAVVFIAAVATMFCAYEIQRRTTSPMFGEKYFVPTNNQIDIRLILGAMVFGLGWGLVGLCPGPAIAGLAFAKTESVVFLVAMICGVWLQSLIRQFTDRASA